MTSHIGRTGRIPRGALAGLVGLGRNLWTVMGRDFGGWILSGLLATCGRCFQPRAASSARPGARPGQPDEDREGPLSDATNNLERVRRRRAGIPPSLSSPRSRATGQQVEHRIPLPESSPRSSFCIWRCLRPPLGKALVNPRSHTGERR